MKRTNEELLDFLGLKVGDYIRIVGIKGNPLFEVKIGNGYDNYYIVAEHDKVFQLRSLIGYEYEIVEKEQK